MKPITSQSTLLEIPVHRIVIGGTVQPALGSTAVSCLSFSRKKKMNNTSAPWNTNTVFNLSYSSPTRAYDHNVDNNSSVVYKVIFGGIASVSFLGNFLLFLTICRRRSLLSKTYNMLLLSLAVTDMLTGQ